MRRARWASLIAILVAGVSFWTAAQQNTGSATGWVQTKKTDPGGDSWHIQFALAGKFLTRPQRNAGEPPALVVACHPHGSRGRFSSASLNVGAPVAIQYVEPPEIKAGTSYNPKVNVRYRLDDGKEIKAQWEPNSDKTSVSLSKDDLKRVLGARTAQFTVEENHAGEVSVQFSIPDSTQLETVCELPVHKK